MKESIDNWVTRLIAGVYCRRDRHAAYYLYRYFRQADDFIDDPRIASAKKTAFLEGQRRRLETPCARTIGTAADSDSAWLYIKQRCDGILQKDLLAMLDIFEFDVGRIGRTVSRAELDEYSLNLCRAYTAILLRFAAPGYRPGFVAVRLASACHQAHILRDFFLDRTLGYVNIPTEEIDRFGLRIDDPAAPEFRQWVKLRVERIIDDLRRGKKYLASAPLKIALIAHLYAFRYETVLRRIVEKGYRLQTGYRMRPRDLLRLCTELARVFIRHGRVFFALDFTRMPSIILGMINRNPSSTGGKK